MRAALLLALAALAFSAPARAQAPPPYLPTFDRGSQCVGLGLGVISPMEGGGFAAKAKRGPALGVQYRYYLLDWIGVGADLGAHMYGKMKAPDGTSFQTSAVTFLAVTRLNLLREQSWTPYVLGGIGFNSFTLKSSPATGSTTPALSEKTMGPAFAGGGGLEFFLLRGLSLALDARWNGYKRPKSADGDFDAVSGQLVFNMWFDF